MSDRIKPPEGWTEEKWAELKRTETELYYRQLVLGGLIPSEPEAIREMAENLDGYKIPNPNLDWLSQLSEWLKEKYNLKLEKDPNTPGFFFFLKPIPKS